MPTLRWIQFLLIFILASPLDQLLEAFFIYETVISNAEYCLNSEKNYKARHHEWEILCLDQMIAFSMVEFNFFSSFYASMVCSKSQLMPLYVESEASLVRSILGEG